MVSFRVPSRLLSSSALRADITTEQLTDLAKAGDAGAQCLLGWHFRTRNDVSQDDSNLQNAFHWYTLSAKGGNATAQNNLGVCYQTGEVPGVLADASEAFKWFSLSANQGHPAGLFNAAVALLNGEGVEANISLARTYLEQSAEMDNPDALFLLATKFQEGADGFQLELAALSTTSSSTSSSASSTAVDSSKIFDLYSRAAAQGHVAAQANLAYCYMAGIGTPVNDKMAVHWYSTAAIKGNSPSAQCHLGWCYWTGKGVDVDKARAQQLFEESVNNGYTPALYNLAMCFKQQQQQQQPTSGSDNNMSNNNYIKYLTQAAELGEMRAQATLGWSYQTGDGVPCNHAEAVKWFRLAAEQGDARSQFNVAWCYQQGQGVEAIDKFEAVRWLRRAALQDHAVAQYNLGYCYITGAGVKQDYKLGVVWYRKAAANGSAKAQYYLGVCYRNGLGVDRDLVQAQHWFEKAAHNGSKEATEALTKLRV